MKFVVETVVTSAFEADSVEAAKAIAREIAEAIGDACEMDPATLAYETRQGEPKSDGDT